MVGYYKEYQNALAHKDIKSRDSECYNMRNVQKVYLQSCLQAISFPTPRVLDEYGGMSHE